MPSSTKKHNLRSKIKTANDKTKEFSCQHCDYVATKPLLLDWHMMTKHKDDPSTEGNKEAVVKDDPDDNKQGAKASFKDMGSTSLKKYKCPECTFNTAQLSKFKQHIKSVHGKIKELVCQQCDYVATQPLHLDLHMTTRHKIANSSTDKIKMKSTSVKIKAEVKLPEENVLIEVRKEFQCSKCSFRSPERVGITNHIKSAHSKLGIVKCIKSCNREAIQ